VAIFLLLAVAVGIAAALLTTPAPAAPGATTTNGSVFLPFWVILAALGGFFALLMAVIVIARLTVGAGGMPLRFSLIVLVAFAVGLGFVVLVHYVTTSGTIGSFTLPQNSTSHGTSPPPNPPVGNLTPGQNNTSPQFQGFDLSGVAEWIGLGLLLVLAIAVAGPIASAFGPRTPDVPSPSSATPATRAVFAEALAKLDAAAEPTDPRLVMIRLYARLLERVGPSLDNVESATPREIERACVERLQIDAPTAARLRRLFERARYSTLPFGPEEIQEAREALVTALAQLPSPRTAA
jgi:hypothetical protein